MQSLEFLLPLYGVRETDLAPRAALCGRRGPSHLGLLAERLELARATVVACVGALRLQNCEFDADVANVLQRHVAETLGLEIERLEALITAPNEPEAS